MRILNVSFSDLSGGAARAAFRLHRGLVAYGIESEMIVNNKQSDDWRVILQARKWPKALNKVRPYIDNYLFRIQGVESAGFRSLAWMSTFKASRINGSNVDVINLHWTCEGLLSVEEIGRVAKPKVWTLYDMWPFMGSEHYAAEDENARWRTGYFKNNRSSACGWLDMDRWVWRRKQKAWKRPIHIICPSRWLADCVRNSVLMHDWPVTVVPYSVDTKVFRPLPTHFAREVLNLPQGVPLILFGAIAGMRDPRKGGDLLQSALGRIAKVFPEAEVIIMGQSEPRDPPAFGLTLHWMGQVHDDPTLALLYSAVDVTVVPSRQEAFGQVGSEAQACGCPVVAFDVTGLPDVVEHKTTGYLAQPYSTDDLARGIHWVLSDDSRRGKLSGSARERAIRLWSYDVVVPQYLEVYQEAIEMQKATGRFS